MVEFNSKLYFTYLDRKEGGQYYDLHLESLSDGIVDSNVVVRESNQKEEKYLDYGSLKSNSKLLLLRASITDAQSELGVIEATNAVYQFDGENLEVFKELKDIKLRINDVSLNEDMAVVVTYEMNVDETKQKIYSYHFKSKVLKELLFEESIVTVYGVDYYGDDKWIFDSQTNQTRETGFNVTVMDLSGTPTFNEYTFKNQKHVWCSSTVNSIQCVGDTIIYLHDH